LWLLKFWFVFRLDALPVADGADPPAGCRQALVLSLSLLVCFRSWIGESVGTIEAVLSSRSVYRLASLTTKQTWGSASNIHSCSRSVPGWVSSMDLGWAGHIDTARHWLGRTEISKVSKHGRWATKRFN
jgi:hypothetical protein